MQDIFDAVKKWQHERVDFGMALLVGAQHSSPRMPGARMVVSEKGEMIGSVSMGCVEADLREHVLQVIAEKKPRMVHYGITDEMAIDVGLSCGGEIDVLVMPGGGLEDSMWGRLMESGPEDAGVLLTGISDDVLGAQILIRADGLQVGHFETDKQHEVLTLAAKELLVRGGTRRVVIPETNTVFFIEAFVLPPNLAIVGATPLAAALCKVAAFAGFQPWVVDPRKAIGLEARFPDARKIEAQWPEEACETLGVDESWYMAVLSHDPKLDLPGLRAALRANCVYVGLLGSGRTQAQRRQALLEEGFSEEKLDHIHGPIGLRIQSKTLEEIAVSIVAEMIQVRAGESRLLGCRLEGC